MIVVERIRERFLGLVPKRRIPHEIIRTRRKIELIRKIEELIMVRDETDQFANLVFDLFGRDEQVCIVLHELSNARQPRQRPRKLIAVQNLALGNAHRQFAIAMFVLFEEQHRIGAVHRLEAHRAIVDIELKHRILIVIPVPARAIQIGIVHNRVKYLDIALCALNFGPIVVQFAIDRIALGLPKNRARRIRMHEEQIELFPQFAVIALLRLFLNCQEGFELVFRRPHRSIDALKHRARRIAAPIGACNARQFEVLAFARATHVRAGTQIRKIALFVNRNIFVGYLIDEFEFIGLIGKKDARFVFRHRAMFKRHVRLDDFFHLRRNRLQIGIGQRTRKIEIVIKSIGYRRTYRKFDLGE